MQQNEMKEFLEMITYATEYYKITISESELEIYWQTLQEFSLISIREAFFAHISNPDRGISHKFPTVGDLIRYLRGDSETQALNAWTRLLQTIRRVGQYNSLVMDDLILHRVIEDMGGWVYLCLQKEKDLNFRMAEFKKRYAAYVLHPPTDYPRKLVGVCEWQNQLKGYPSQPPLLVGDPVVAERIYRLGHAAKNISSRLLLTSDQDQQEE